MIFSRRRFLFSAPAVIAVTNLMPLSALPNWVALRDSIVPIENAGTIQIGRNQYRYTADGSVELVDTVPIEQIIGRGSWANGMPKSLDFQPFVPGDMETGMERRAVLARKEDYAKQAAIDAKWPWRLHGRDVLVATSPEEVPQIKAIARKTGKRIFARVDPWHGKSAGDWRMPPTIDGIVDENGKPTTGIGFVPKSA